MFGLVIGGAAVVAGLGLMGALRIYNERESRWYDEAMAEYEEGKRCFKPDEPRLVKPVVGLAPVAVGALVIGLSCIYTQDIGEAVVLRNLGGSIAGHTEEAGFHLKAPWQDALTWDIRNRQINFFKDSEYSYDGGSYTGAEVSINDASGTKANIDIQVIYSLDADEVESLYAEYGTQEAFVTNYVSNDLRATAREVAGGFDTLTLLTDRAQYTNAVSEALAEQWKGKGVIVEQVQVQDIRYADSVTDAYADAQTAEVARQKAENAQETARVEAETAKIEAQGEADANRILAESLTPEVLRQQYIAALAEVAWTPESERNYKDFIARLRKFMPILEKARVEYCPLSMVNVRNPFKRLKIVRTFQRKNAHVEYNRAMVIKKRRRYRA